MSEVPTLGLPDFDKPFVLETDASASGVRVVLVQEGRSLAFLNKALAPRHLGLSIYEKELLAVLMVVDKWRHYLEGSKFVIKTDHESLKFLLQQKLLTQLQWKGMTKLMGLDYVIQYRKGKEYLAANALSRCYEAGHAAALMVVVPDWHREVVLSYETDESIQELLQQLVVDPNAKQGYTLSRTEGGW